MRKLDRRQVLTSAAAGTGIALGVGAASSQSTSVSNDQVGTDAIEASFQATAGEGYITIDADNPQGDGSSIGRVDFAGSDLGGDVEISGEAYDDDTWESTNVSFPDIDVMQFLEGADLPIDPSQIDADVNVTVDTITGTFDREENFMTADFQLTVDISASIMGGVVTTDFAITANAPLTTGESGELTGSATGMNTNEATVRLVCNNFTIPATGEVIDPPLVDPINIDDEIGLPADDPSRNYLELELDMDLSEIFAFLQGSVTDSSDNGLSGANIEVLSLDDGSTVATTTADASGSFNLQVSPGMFEIVVTAEGYQSKSTVVQVAENETAEPDFSMEEIPTGTVSGTVTDGDDPLSGATIEATDTTTGAAAASKTTGSNGTFEISVEAEKTHEIIVDAEGYDPVGDLVSVAEGETQTLNIDMGTELEPATITGVVRQVTEPRDLLDAVDIGVVDPITEELVAQTTSGSGGSYALDVQPGEYRIVVNRDGYLPFADAISVSEGEIASVDVDLSVDFVVPALAAGLSPPKDLDGDGLYEDVRGDNQTDVFDVQALFQHMDSPVVQNHSEYFNFSNGDPSKVTVFDIQSLFRKVN